MLSFSLTTSGATSAGCTFTPAQPCKTRTLPTGGVVHLRHLFNIADQCADQYAETGCLSALGGLHRAELLIKRILGEA